MSFIKINGFLISAMFLSSGAMAAADKNTDQVAENLSNCITKAISPKELPDFEKWVFLGISANKKLENTITLKSNIKTDLDKFIAKKMTHFIVDECQKESIEAIRVPNGLGIAGENVISHIIKNMMMNTETTSSLSDFKIYIDNQEIEKALK